MFTVALGILLTLCLCGQISSMIQIFRLHRSNQALLLRRASLDGALTVTHRLLQNQKQDREGRLR